MESDTRPLVSPAPAELIERARRAADLLGIRQAARRLGVSRESLLGLIAAMPVRQATAVMVASRLPEVEQDLAA